MEAKTLVIVLAEIWVYKDRKHPTAGGLEVWSWCCHRYSQEYPIFPEKQGH